MKARTGDTITPGDGRQERRGDADERAHLAAEIVAAAVLRGHFTLRSGATSDYYIDKYRFTTQPALLTRITDALLPHVPSDTQRIAGTVLGAVPLAVCLSLRTGLPSVLVRADAKAYGTAKAVEGELDEGERVLLIEDVVTSGGAAIAALEALRAAGAEVNGILAVIDREDGGAQRLASAEVPFLALFTRTELGLGGS